MGVWDHFYENSIFGEEVSTHYVNLPHYIHYDQRSDILFDEQYEAFEWFDLNKVANGNEFHRYLKSYASGIISRET